MWSVGAAELLQAWEASRGARDLQRAVELLHCTSSLTGEALAALPVGRVDALLLDLRDRAFGTDMECEVHCPACAERLEFLLHTSSLRIPPAEEEADRHTVEADGVKVRFRMPTAADFDACGQMPTPDEAGQALVVHCIEAIEPAGAVLPQTLLEAVAERIAALDPQAIIPIGLTCPQCAHAWIEAFDIPSFVAREVDHWAERLLDEVHVLAAGYGWSERDILALSAARRRYYVERVAG